MNDGVIRLTALAHGGGCGCKLAPSVPQALLSGQASCAAGEAPRCCAGSLLPAIREQGSSDASSREQPGSPTRIELSAYWVECAARISARAR
jgi:hypothetical protein